MTGVAFRRGSCDAKTKESRERERRASGKKKRKKTSLSNDDGAAAALGVELEDEVVDVERDLADAADDVADLRTPNAVDAREKAVFFPHSRRGRGTRARPRERSARLVHLISRDATLAMRKRLALGLGGVVCGDRGDLLAH